MLTGKLAVHPSEFPLPTAKFDAQPCPHPATVSSRSNRAASGLSLFNPTTPTSAQSSFRSDHYGEGGMIFMPDEEAVDSIPMHYCHGKGQWFFPNGNAGYRSETAFSAAPFQVPRKH